MCVCVYVCVVIPFILDARLVDVPAGVTQEEGHTGFLHLASAVLALIFLARKIQPFLFLVDRDVEFCVLMNLSFSPCKPHLPRDDSPSLSLQCMSHAVLSKFIKYICIYIYIGLTSCRFKALDSLKIAYARFLFSPHFMPPRSRITS